MTKVFALDTNALSYSIKGKSREVDNIIINNIFTIPPYVHYEILYWLKKNNSVTKLKSYQELFELREVLSVEEYSVMEIANEIRLQQESNGMMIDNMDLFIASWCIATKTILVTANVRHFEKIKELKICPITL